MSEQYVPTIGLEIHAELRTATKMFCRSRNDADEERPNVNICPVCMAHPGTLPVINREAVRHVLRVGLALNGTLAEYTEFDRKNYFYPDLPKGYQLSQYEYPLVSGGALRGVQITRVHLEEDTASSMHEHGVTTIDYNRAGVPLMELVTEPVIRSADEAGEFARELQLLLRVLGASDANMEKGEMRVEANVSVARAGERGTKVEIKNLNSFNIMERAVRHEIARQTELLERGTRVSQETRGWDERRQATFAQRTKEGSADYRYFPDPDLPSLMLTELSEFDHEQLRAAMPTLPWERRDTYRKLGVKAEDADLFVREPSLGRYFDTVIADYANDAGAIRLAANFVANDIVNIIRDAEKRETEIQSEIPISARFFNEIIELLHASRISMRTAKDLFAMAVAEQRSPKELAEAKKLFQKSGSDLDAVVDGVLKANPAAIGDFRAGKQPALEFLVGQCMRALRGAGDPSTLRELLRQKIG